MNSSQNKSTLKREVTLEVILLKLSEAGWDFVSSKKMQLFTFTFLPLNFE